MVASFHATGPTNTGLGILILTTIQPCAVDRTFHGVYAGLFEGVCILEDPDYGVISLRWIVANTATSVSAMIRGL
jgi:hypothetical protein